MLRKVETGSGTRCIARGGEGGRRGLKLNAVKSNVCVSHIVCRSNATTSILSLFEKTRYLGKECHLRDMLMDDS